MVWDPARVTPRSWNDIVDFYRHLEERNDDFRPMRLLAEHIGGRPDACRLYAATSGTALLVARRSDNDWSCEGVRIDVRFDASIRFVVQTRSPARPKISRCEPAAIADAFERVLRDASGPD